MPTSVQPWPKRAAWLSPSTLWIGIFRGSQPARSVSPKTAFSCKLPHQPAVHGAQAQPVRLRQAFRPGNVPQNPGHLCRGEICRHRDTGALTHRVSDAGALPIGADIRRPGALPDDGIAHGFTGNSVPGYGGLPLVADAHADDVRRRDARLFRGQTADGQGIPEDLFRIMGHPARVIDDLPVGQVRPGKHPAARVKDHGLGALGALVHGQHIFRHFFTPPVPSSRYRRCLSH